MQGKCIGNTLEIFEEFIRNAREMHGEYIGNIRGLMHEKCIGNVLEICENFIRNSWEMHGEYVGNIRGLY